MKAIGIKLDVEPMSFDQLNNNLAKGDWDMLMDGWSTGPDPTYLLSHPDLRHPAAGRRHERQHGRVLLQQGVRQAVRPAVRRSSTRQERAATIGKMQEILYAGNADLILFYKNGLSALRTDQVRTTCRASQDADGFYPLQHGFTSWWKASRPPVRPASEQAERAAAPTPSSRIGIGVLVVVVIGGVVFLMRRRTASERE